MKRRAKNDIIKTKEASLTTLRSKSTTAIEMVRRMVSDLEKVNEQIEESKTEIDTYMARLTETKSGLTHTYEKNQKIAQNFKKLLDDSEE